MLSSQNKLLSVLSIILIITIFIIVYIITDDIDETLIITSIFSGILIIIMFIINKYFIIYETETERNMQYLNNLLEYQKDEDELRDRFTNVYTYQNLPIELLQKKLDELNLRHNKITPAKTILQERINTLNLIKKEGVSQEQFNKNVNDGMSLSRENIIYSNIDPISNKDIKIEI